MQHTFNLTQPEQGVLEQILTDLEVKSSAELDVMKAEGDRMVAEAFAQRTPVAILHRRVGNREKLETFLRHAQAVRQIPCVRHSIMLTKISENFAGTLELRSSNPDAELAFRNAISAVSPFFHEIIATEEEGCFIVRAVADLFEPVAFTESLGAET